MKKFLLFFFFLASTCFAENLVLDNQTSFPIAKSKIAVQWASSARGVDEANKALVHGLKLNPASMQLLSQTGKIVLNIPKKAEYFRVLAWTGSNGKPDLHTNWVQIVPNKTYTLEADHLVPTALLSGSGC